MRRRPGRLRGSDGAAPLLPRSPTSANAPLLAVPTRAPNPSPPIAANVAFAFFLMMGSVGFYSSWFFVRYIYSSIKTD